ncbi:MAG: Asp23/Gls24 family envelope stress response protein [Lachnospiraceae bacterium]|nr:Asp23/Gls24 family envelope stress response protein [Lachnospiraceae bacterium]
MGNVIITPDVIAQFAGAQALECFGIVGMAAKSTKDSVMHLLKKESLKKGIEVTITDNNISISFHVIVAYGLNIVSVTENLMENVKYKLEEFTGMKVSCINVLVEGVRVID